MSMKGSNKTRRYYDVIKKFRKKKGRRCLAMKTTPQKEKRQTGENLPDEKSVVTTVSAGSSQATALSSRRKRCTQNEELVKKYWGDRTCLSMPMFMGRAS